MGAAEIKNLLLSQSYHYSFSEFEVILKQPEKKFWDYIFITASNERQARIYEKQIEIRLNEGRLPKRTQFIVLPDTEGKRIGSGGATLNVLRYISFSHPVKDFFYNNSCLLIHSGGDSKRIPQYSACGKLFMPIPHEDLEGNRLTLFDEIIAGTASIPQKIGGGMMVLSGDVLMLFEPLQIAVGTEDIIALTIKEKNEKAIHHGVFACDENGYVEDFLHKVSIEEMKSKNAVDDNGMVHLDTGAVILGSNILNSFFDLISNNGLFDYDKYKLYVNDNVKLSFYGDFLYPMAANSNIESYYSMPSEANSRAELLFCRENIWKALREFRIKTILLSPGAFIHLGTTRQLLSFFTEQIDDYACFGWQRFVHTNIDAGEYTANNAFIDENSKIGKSSYIEDSIIGKNTVVGKNCIISNVNLHNVIIPDDTVVHGIRLLNEKYVVRVYKVDSNPNENIFCLSVNEKNSSLWEARLFPIRNCLYDALKASLEMNGVYSCDESFISLKDSFYNCDENSILEWQSFVNDKVRVSILVDSVKKGMPLSKTKDSFKKNPLTIEQQQKILDIAENSEFFLKIKLYYYLSRIADNKANKYEDLCFDTIRNAIGLKGEDSLYNPRLSIKKETNTVNLPLRVNFGGGWSDTPPYCNEFGGNVLNGAIKLLGRLPVEVTVKKLDEYKIILESTDLNIKKEIDSVKDVLDCQSPQDYFSLQKAALLAFGVIPFNENKSLEEILRRLKGGIYLSTAAIGVPRGSGLGTSSILLCACMKAFSEFFEVKLSENDIINRVIYAEQIMNTGGGWQDQIGGMTNGIKLITSDKGLIQKMRINKLDLTKTTKDELEQRFCLIYTGQRRLARNILREVLGRYLATEEKIMDAFYQIQLIANEMKVALESGNIDEFAALLNKHWEYSKLIDESCTNESIEMIFSACEDMIDGRMICGAGGGGFLQVILKKKYSKNDLNKRLKEIFNFGNIEVFDSEFLF